MKIKVQPGDILLCYSPYHLERVKVAKVDGGVITLANQVKVDKHLNILNSKNPDLKVELMDEEKYRMLYARSMMDKVLYKINSGAKDLNDENVVRVFDKLTKLAERYF